MGRGCYEFGGGGAVAGGDAGGVPRDELARHVTIWNRLECRKIAGNAAPLRRNLERYLTRHPECEVYVGQDKLPGMRSGIDEKTGERIVSQNEHVPIWHKVERRKVTGNAAPLRKNLLVYLRKHPECEEYVGQDKLPNTREEAVPEPQADADGMELSSNMNSMLPPAFPEVHEGRAWNTGGDLSRSIPIPGNNGSHSEDMGSVFDNSLGLHGNSHDLSAFLNSPLGRSSEHDVTMFTGSAEPSPSYYLFQNSPHPSVR